MKNSEPKHFSALSSPEGIFKGGFKSSGFTPAKALLFKCPYDTHSCYRSLIEMIAKISHLGKLGKAKAKAKRGDLGVKTQAVLRLKVSCFERQSNLSCEAK